MINFILAFTLARVLYGRGLFPHTKATFIALMAVAVGAYTESWEVFALSIPSLFLLIKPDAGHRYMAFNPIDVRDYENNPWMCKLVDKIMNTHRGDLMTKRELRQWGIVYGAIQSLFIIPLLALGDWWLFPLALMRGPCWYAVKWLPDDSEKQYGGMAADALEGLLFSLLVVAAYGQIGA